MYNEVIYSNLKEKVYINQSQSNCLNFFAKASFLILKKWRAMSLIISIILFLYIFNWKQMCFKKKKKKLKLKANVISLEILTTLLFSRCQYLLVSCSPYFVFLFFIFFMSFSFYHTIANPQFQFQSSMITIRLRIILYSLNSYEIWNTND